MQRANPPSADSESVSAPRAEFVLNVRLLGDKSLFTRSLCRREIEPTAVFAGGMEPTVCLQVESSRQLCLQVCRQLCLQVCRQLCLQVC